jgi:hypothetical protein
VAAFLALGLRATRQTSGFAMTVADTLAPYHNEVRGGISFVDGHSEIHKWKGAATKPPVTSSGSPPRLSFV